ATLLRGHTGAVTAVAFAPDGRSLVSASQDGSVKVWDVAARQDPNRLVAIHGHLQGEGDVVQPVRRGAPPKRFLRVCCHATSFVPSPRTTRALLAVAGLPLADLGGTSRSPWTLHSLSGHHRRQQPAQPSEDNSDGTADPAKCAPTA